MPKALGRMVAYTKTKKFTEIEEYFLKDFPFSFLNHPFIKKTMFTYTFGKWKNIQKTLISNYFLKDEAHQILREYNIGRPLLNDIEYNLTSILIYYNILYIYNLYK